MANIVIKLPFGNPLDPPLMTLVDQGDGTFAPRVSGTVQISGNSSTNNGGKKGGKIAVTNAGAADGQVQIVTSGSSGTTGQRLVADATGYLVYEDKRIASNVATGGTVAQVVTALINAGLMASS